MMRLSCDQRSDPCVVDYLVLVVAAIFPNRSGNSGVGRHSVWHTIVSQSRLWSKYISNKKTTAFSPAGSLSYSATARILFGMNARVGASRSN